MLGAEGTEKREREAVAEFGVHGDAEEDLGLIRDVLAELLHQALDFGERESVAAGDVDDDVLRVLEKVALVDERALERLLERLGHAVRAAGLAKAEKTARIRGAQRAHEIGKSEAHEKRKDVDKDRRCRNND